ncbi:hypothetical protein V6N13_070296 [Hibiscus sabdariffa]
MGLCLGVLTHVMSNIVLPCWLWAVSLSVPQPRLRSSSNDKVVSKVELEEDKRRNEEERVKKLSMQTKWRVSKGRKREALHNQKMHCHASLLARLNETISTLLFATTSFTCPYSYLS